MIFNKDFCVGLKKQKVKLTASQQMELLPLFDERKKQISEICAHIKTIQTSLDDIIFSFYQIPSDISDMIKSRIQITGLEKNRRFRSIVRYLERRVEERKTRLEGDGADKKCSCAKTR